MYALGIDLGTTFTAAATWRDGHSEIVSLGSRGTAVPSVVLLREDETFLTGEAAARRGLTEPHRVAREFKRRLGDTTPILLGGVPQSAEGLAGHLLRAVAGQVTEREGGPPATTCVSHPANWGPYKTDLIRQAVAMADLPGRVVYTTEPEAAAVNYAHQQRVEPGAVVAVYDLGGGTFDVAVLRKTATGFEILGRPEGIERLGGIDFDAAVFEHVRVALGGKLAELDEDDATAIAAVARLREECVTAKEALSSDTDTSIPVLLPNVVTEIRLTRSELEAMVRPALHGSVEALRRAIRSAGCAPDDLHAVLLVGGSSRMPVVAQLVGAEIGRPVAVDAHPKHAVALGAAWLAAGARRSGASRPPGGGPVAGRAAAPRSPAPYRSAPQSPAPQPATRAPAPQPGPRSQAPHSPAPHSPAPQSPAPQSPARPPAPARAQRPASATAMAGVAAVPRPPEPRTGGPTGEQPTVVRPTGDQPVVARATTRPAPPGTARPQPGGRNRRRRVLLGAGAAVVTVLAAAGVAWARFGGEPAGDGKALPEVPVNAASAAPADEQCTDELRSNRRWVCLTSAVIADGRLTVAYDVDFAGSAPDVSGGYHLHLWGSDGTYPPDHSMGSHVDSGSRGEWYVEDRRPSVLDLDDERFTRAVGDAPKICARIALAGHGLVHDRNDGYATGNCVPISRE